MMDIAGKTQFQQYPPGIAAVTINFGMIFVWDFKIFFLKF